MSTLQSYGDKSPPNVKVESTIPHPNRPVIIGHIGYDEERDERVAMLPRDAEEHYFRKYKGYAVSRSILDQFAAKLVDKICIVEKNGENRVFEFERQQFKDGSFVAYDDESNSIVESEVEYLNNQSKYNDPQQVLAVDESLYVWEKSEVSLYE